MWGTGGQSCSSLRDYITRSGACGHIPVFSSQRSSSVGRWRWTRHIPNRLAASTLTVTSAASSEVSLSASRRLCDEHLVAKWWRTVSSSLQMPTKTHETFATDITWTLLSWCWRNSTVICPLFEENCHADAFPVRFSLNLFLLFILTVKDEGKPITVVYVPSHLYHMVFELFKVCVSNSELARRVTWPHVLTQIFGTRRTPCGPQWSYMATPWSILPSTPRWLWEMKIWQSR